MKHDRHVLTASQRNFMDVLDASLEVKAARERIRDAKKGGRKGKAPEGLIAALDIGSSKIACYIALHEREATEVLGVGHQLSQGIRKGQIVDMDAAERAIRATVDAAEQTAGQTIRDVVVALPGVGLNSKLVHFNVDIGGQKITSSDLKGLFEPAGYRRYVPAGHELIHVLPVGLTLDEERVDDPIGLFGNTLGVHVHLISAKHALLRNLAQTLSRAHLRASHMVAAPLAGGLSVLSDDERRLGAAIVDMGGGTTTLSVFYDGALIHCCAVPVGGHNVTNDIAQCFTTPLGFAERLKTLHGRAIPSPTDESKMLDIKGFGESGWEDEEVIPRAALVDVIRPRIEETFEILADHLVRTQFNAVVGNNIILTGGAAQLPGVAEVAAQAFGRKVRIARPARLPGVAEGTAGPGFSVCTGMIRHLTDKNNKQANQLSRPPGGPGGFFGSLGQWLKENF